MNVRSQQAVGELDHCIAEVDDGVARERLNVAPLRVSAWREDLQASKAVEEDRHAAEVGVFAESCSAIVLWLRRCFHEADLVTAAAVDSVHALKCALREGEMVVQQLKDEGHY